MHTVATLIEAICDQFQQAGLSYGHGTDNPWDEAVALVLAITGAADDTESLERQIPDHQARRIIGAAEQRIATRQPLAYLLGRCQYMGFEFLLRPGVVVPRSPIGYLLFEGLEPWLPKQINHVVDLCSGSGCLGILAAHAFPSARVTLVEIDDAAVEVAGQNIELHGLQDRVEILQTDATGELAFANPVDLVVSNPPYVDDADMSVLPPEFQAEPRMGLAAGVDGLSVITPMLAHLPSYLAPEGLFVGEVGASARALAARFADVPFIWLDLPHGGEGVFVLEATSLNSHTAPGF